MYKAKTVFNANIKLFSTTKNFYLGLVISEMKDDLSFTVISNEINRKLTNFSEKVYVIKVGSKF